MKTSLVQKIILSGSVVAFSIVSGGQIVQAETITKQTASEANSLSDTTNLNQLPTHSSADALNLESANTKTLQITQSDIEIEPGTATRSGSSYIGIGGNIGFTGDTSVGKGAFAAISKIGLTNFLSLRPSAIIEDNAVFLLPITVDFSGDDVPNADFSVAPYLGGGLAISTGRDDTVGPLISGGLDIPLSSEFTANAGVNVTFIDDTDVGLLLGVGYNF